MFLPADRERSINANRARLDDRYVPVGHAQRVSQVAAGVDRIRDRQDGRQRFVLRGNARRASPGGVQRLAENPGDRLVVEEHLAGKQRLIAAVRSAVSLTGHIRFRQYRNHATRV
jgi:hypothetical protein